MYRSLLAALVAVPLFTAGAASAQEHGYVVQDPYAAFPPIRLDDAAPEPPAAPDIAAPVPSPRPLSPRTELPDGAAPLLGVAPPVALAPSPLTPERALGLAIQTFLGQELDRVLLRDRFRGNDDDWEEFLEDRQERSEDAREERKEWREELRETQKEAREARREHRKEVRERIKERRKKARDD